MTRKERMNEVARFGVVGVVATAIQYGIYWWLVDYMNETLANTIGYLVSFCCNFLLTTYFTFRVSPSKKRAEGFALSHLVNWAMQSGVLNAALWLGVPSKWAPIPMFAVCVPINFLLVRYFVKLRR